jgi:hypothetical protein
MPLDLFAIQSDVGPSGEVGPPCDDDVAVFGLDLKAQAGPSELFCGD